MTRLLKVLQSALFFTIFIVMVGIFGNWLFAILWGGAIRSFDRWTGGGVGVIGSILVLFLFIIVFPIFYLLQVRLLVLTRALETIWKEYRSDVFTVVVDRAVETTIVLKQQGGTLVSSSQEWFSELPRLLRWLLHYLKQKIPFVEEVEKALGNIDWDAEQDATAIKQQVAGQVQSTLETSELPMDSSFVWWLVGVNIVVMILVLLVIML